MFSVSQRITHTVIVNKTLSRLFFVMQNQFEIKVPIFFNVKKNQFCKFCKVLEKG